MKLKEYQGIPGIVLENSIAKAIWNHQQVDNIDSDSEHLQDISGSPVYLCDDLDNCYGILRFTDLSLPVQWIAQFNFPKKIESKKQEGKILTDIVLDSSSVPISLKFIGTAGLTKSVSDLHNHFTSLIIDSGGKRLLFNYGILNYPNQLKDIHPDAIFLTNGHTHHVAGLKEGTKSSIYAPPDAIKELNKFSLDTIQEINPGQTVTLSLIKVTALDVIHSVNSSTYAYLIDIANKKILFAPDIVNLKNKSILKEIDIFIGDATYLKQGGISKDSKEVYGHSPIETQMEWCRRYDIPTLILTNFGEQAISLTERKLEREINEIKKRKSPDIQVILAHDGMEYLGKSMSIEMIQYASQYDPTNANNKVLLNDLKAVMNWYSTSKSTYKEIKFSEKEILSLMNGIYKEIYSRTLSGNMQYSISPSRMSVYSQEALGKLRAESSKEIDYLINAKHGEIEDNDLDSLEIVEELSTYANVGHSKDHDLGDEIYIEEILNSWSKPIIISKGFIQVVGGVANYGKSTGDLDVLIRKKKPKGNEDIPLKFRLYRALNSKTGDRIQWIYDSEEYGPFTNHYQMYDLVLVPSERKLVEMSQEESEEDISLQRVKSKSAKADASKSRREDKVIPHRYFLFPKPMHGRKIGEIYTLDSVIRTIKSHPQWRGWEDKGVILQKKHDGVSIFAHKTGDKVSIYTDDGGNLTNNLPTIVKELKSIDSDFVVVGEAEAYIDGEHQNRSVSNGILHAHNHTNERDIRLTLYDITWFNGKDIHSEPYSKRVVSLDKIPSKEHIKHTDRKVATTEEAIREGMEHFNAQEGSEGTMLKLKDFKFELDGKALTTIKFKNELILNCKVLGKHLIKGTKDTYFYYIGFSDNTIAGKTFSSKVQADRGDVLKIIFVNINKYEDPKTEEIFYKIWSPRVSEKTTEKASSTQLADKLAKATTGGERWTGPFEKRLPKDIRDAIESKVIKLFKGSDYPPEDKVYRFGVQHHYRSGAEKDPKGLSSLHSDFRMESENGIGGFTWADQIEGKVPHVTNLKEAKDADKKIEAFKINWNTGKFKEHITKAGHKVRKEIYAVPKQDYTLPREQRTRILLDLEGVFPPSEKGISTKYGPGIFTQIDNGQIEYGVKKLEEFEEYWLHGKKLNGRLIHRKLPAGTYKRVGKDKFFWVAIQPLDQSAYILSNRARDKKYITPYNISALPRAIRKKIPQEYQYWNIKDTTKRRQVRNGLIEAIKQKEVKID